MTRNQVDRFRRTLEASVVELDCPPQREGILIEGTSDEVERVLRSAEREIAVWNLEAASVKRREARAALRRLEAGTYGCCVECEAPIGARRLTAVPWAALCIRCQQASDCRCGAKAARTALALAA